MVNFKSHLAYESSICFYIMSYIMYVLFVYHLDPCLWRSDAERMGSAAVLDLYFALDPLSTLHAILQSLVHNNLDFELHPCILACISTKGIGSSVY